MKVDPFRHDAVYVSEDNRKLKQLIRFIVRCKDNIGSSEMN